MNGTSSLVKVVNDPYDRIDSCFSALKNSRQSAFILCLGSTMTSDIEGISAAGATAADRRLTPRYDAEALVLGKTADGSSIPVSPVGIASPVVLTRACLRILESNKTIVDCGTFAPPRIDSIQAGTLPAQCVSSGNALPLDHVYDLFERGLKIGRDASENNDLVVVGECVPGGTTTAMAVLTGMGNSIASLVSSSIPEGGKGNGFERRIMLVNEGLEMAGLGKGKTKEQEPDPFVLLSKVGDPMQPVAAGIAIGASSKASVVLAGGSQMLAVHNIAAKMASGLKDAGLKSAFLNSGLVITTRWVAYDPSADTPALAKILDIPMACTTFQLKNSRHPGLRAYEEGHVKEGVGAGATIALAHIARDKDEASLLHAIEETYQELVDNNSIK